MTLELSFLPTNTYYASFEWDQINRNYGRIGGWLYQRMYEQTMLYSRWSAK